ncbi:MAG: A24 family peptidase [Alphaproteobacteria bacterium]|nr:A24 family peptidase [Alphaproteobacteria bacterium]
MPADAGTALYYSFHIYHIHKKSKKSRLKTRNNLLKRLLISSLLYAFFGIFIACFITTYNLPNSYIILVFLCSLMSNIDNRYFILPDILTIPLLILGFFYSTINYIDIPPTESAIGAILGYLLPTLSSFLMFIIHPSKLGGGDIKLLSAIGAWLGIEGLIITICFSFIFFSLKVLLYKQKECAYGNSALLGILGYFVLKYIFEIELLLLI